MPLRKHIVLITTKQLSSNPRLVKEAIALKEANFDVTVVYNFWSHWAEAADADILQQNKSINWIMAGFHPVRSKLFYFYSRGRYKCIRQLAGLFKKNFLFQVFSSAQFYPELKKKASGIPASLYIAHNAGALPAALYAAKKNNSKYAFDAEDFHRSQEEINGAEYQSITLIENNCFPGASYITAASPLIAAEYKKHYPALNFTIINNVFSRLQQPVFSKLEKTPFKLFWFSQTVGLKRGVQDAIAAINCISSFPVVLTILGDANEQVKLAFNAALKNKQHQLVFLPPCNETALINEAAKHHVGLALEPGFSINNNIALSNKLFTYLLVGNAVILSSTPAQKLFFNEYPQVGWCYAPGDIAAMQHIIIRAFNDQAMLTKKREFAWRLANTSLNWENEQYKFLDLVKAVV